MGVALITNNAYGSLNSSITSSETTIVLGSGEGARFPAISGSNYFYATLVNTGGDIEIVKVTARSTDTFTVTREQEGTVGAAFAAGSRLELRPTAALMGTFMQVDSADVPAASEFIRRNAGDTAYEGVAPAAVRTALGLVIGTDVADKVTTTRGDLVRAGASGVDERVALGTTGHVLTSDGTDAVWSAASGLSAASQAEMEAAALNTVAATPGRAQYHPGVAKAWVYITISGGTVTVAAGHNVSSVTDNAAGDFTTNFTTAFSSASYVWVSMAQRDTGNTNNHNVVTKGDTAPTDSAHRWQVIVGTTSLVDPPSACVAYFGDQA